MVIDMQYNTIVKYRQSLKEYLTSNYKIKIRYISTVKDTKMEKIGNDDILKLVRSLVNTTITNTGF